MKKLTRWATAVLLMATTMTACSSDDEVADNQQPLNYRYTTQNLYPQDSLITTSTKNGRTITSYGNIILKIDFEPSLSLSPEQLMSPEQNLANYLPLSADNGLHFNGSLKNAYINYASFLQFYKGIMVWNCGMIFNLDQDDTLINAKGRFIPINDLDVHPAISEDKAKRILKSALHIDSDIPISLHVVPFFVDGKVDVRLAYLFEEYEGGFIVYRTIVDAHTEEILCFRGTDIICD